uniref:Uncharacterized protein LOC101500123 isoform X2 n=1 Tax=Cicer arietinum TaxID=3827 RepID=A0A3Q7YB45_CICAR|nr:uncharacterized protein LOC101500123 isoform X2 [Cicer arietinum]
MVKLASARDFRTYGPGLSRNRYEYINAGLYLFATVILCSGFAAQFSHEPRSGLVLLLIALALIVVVNLHDILAHFAGIDFRLALMSFDLQLFFVEFAVPVVQIIGTLLLFLGLLFILIQEEKGYGYVKLEKHAVNMLVAGPVLWVVGSIHNSCQIYERADVLNYRQRSRVIHHGIYLLGGTWIWLGIFGSLMFFIGGLTNLIKVFKMQQMNGTMRLEKLRGGAQERLISAREGRVPLILDHHHHHQPIINRPEDTKVDISLPTPYKDVLIGQTTSS